MQFNYNEDFPPLGTPAVSLDEDGVKLERPHVRHCFRHSARVLRNGREEVALYVIVPHNATAQQGHDDDDRKDKYSSDGDSSDDSQDSFKSENPDESTYAYMLDRSIKETIYGQVWQGTLLRKTAIPSGARIWEVTDRRCAVKECNLQELRRQQGSAENPWQEISAMQFLHQHFRAMLRDDDDEEPGINEILRAEQMMYDRNIMMPYEALIDNHDLFIVMPYCPGSELFDFLSERSFFPEDQARYLFNQILNAYETLQSAGICHRDMSLENILLDTNGSGIVIDLGMCFKIPYGNGYDADQSMTTRAMDRRHQQRFLIAPDRSCGKPYYTAPEIRRSQEPFDGHAIDIWAAGPILFLLVTGFPPWEHASLDDERFRIFSSGGLVEVLNSWNLGTRISPDVMDLLQRMFFLDPRDRLGLNQIRAHPWMSGPMNPPR